MKTCLLSQLYIFNKLIIAFSDSADLDLRFAGYNTAWGYFLNFLGPICANAVGSRAPRLFQPSSHITSLFLRFLSG